MFKVNKLYYNKLIEFKKCLNISFQDVVAFKANLRTIPVKHKFKYKKKHQMDMDCAIPFSQIYNVDHCSGFCEN